MIRKIIYTIGSAFMFVITFFLAGKEVLDDRRITKCKNCGEYPHTYSRDMVHCSCGMMCNSGFGVVDAREIWDAKSYEEKEISFNNVAGMEEAQAYRNIVAERLKAVTAEGGCAWQEAFGELYSCGIDKKCEEHRTVILDRLLEEEITEITQEKNDAE